MTLLNGLRNPASIVFSVGEGNEKSIFFTHFLPAEPAANPGPAVLKLDVGVEGVPAIMPEPAVAQGTANICSVFPDGKTAAGFVIYVRDADDRLVLPNPASVKGLKVSSRSGCHKATLPPGAYYVTGQKTIDPSKGLNFSGTTHFEVSLGNPVEVEIVLTE